MADRLHPTGMDIDGGRLRADLEANAEFGAIDTAEGRGRTVRCATAADRAARDYLVERLEDAALAVSVDAVGNVAGRYEPPGCDPEAPAVASGSHLDSVPEGGIFDGPLGVYAALESVRAIAEAGRPLARPIEVVCFTEEEGGRFSNGVLGSTVATGMKPVEQALGRTDADGVTLESALGEIGYLGDGRLDAAGWDAWLELHVEQDTRLEDLEVPVGIVDTITGIAHCRAVLTGEANHAGATPMPGRRDALAAAAEVVLDLERAANEVVANESASAVGTVGRLEVSPNATNVVPGRVELGVDIRDVRADTMSELVEAVRESLHRVAAARGVETAFEQVLDLAPTPMADRCRTALRRAGERLGLETVELHSQAAHDTVNVAAVTDAGMLFAPSRNGVSHSPLEWTDWADCARATGVLAEGLATLAER